MADEFKVIVHGLEEAKREAREVVKRQNRATMWALRDVGRKMKQAAKRNAPSDTGTLKESIRSLKRLKGNAATGYTNMVGPMQAIKAGKVSKKGNRPISDVRFYRAKEEAANRFMAAALEEIAPQIKAIHEAAWARAMSRK